MRFPILNASPDAQQTTEVFLGYNHNLRIGDGEFYDLLNMTSDRAPVLSTRNPRGLYLQTDNVQGMIAKDSLCYVDGTQFVMNGYPYDLNLSTRPEDCPKQLISMGAYVIILPDKKYINTANTADRGGIEADFTTVAPVTFTPCKIDGSTFTPDYIQPTEPTDPPNMALWMDTSVTPHSLKQYSSSAGYWTGIATTYIKIESGSLGTQFKQYDGVHLNGLKDLDVLNAEQLAALEGAAIVYAQDDDSIVIVGILDSAVTVETPVRVSRKMPAMDFVVESNNRLWGCRYGLNNNGDVVNELYACKQGDFKNWNCFMGISTDSYAVSLGSDGQFTGAITHAGHPLFFKENVLHKVYGQIPANFQVQNTTCRGVQKGSHDSMAIVNEILYYKSQHHICAYDGSLPQEISSVLGEVQYKDAIAASYANKYYISMAESQSGKRQLFVYDTAKGLWEKENDPGTKCLCSCRDELYVYTGSHILSLLGSGYQWERDVEWMAETGIINAISPDRTYLKKIHLRLTLDMGSSMEILVQYDSLGTWEHMAYLTGTDTRSFEIPIRPRRCDHLRLRIQGTGSCLIYAMTRSMSQGSDKV